jgi:hypothetical protein
MRVSRGVTNLVVSIEQHPHQVAAGDEARDAVSALYGREWRGLVRLAVLVIDDSGVFEDPATVIVVDDAGPAQKILRCGVTTGECKQLVVAKPNEILAAVQP